MKVGTHNHHDHRWQLSLPLSCGSRVTQAPEQPASLATPQPTALLPPTPTVPPPTAWPPLPFW